MKIHLERIEQTPEYTVGRLTVEGFECWTLEDPVRDGEKIHGKTAIPAGEYKVVRDYSNRFNRWMLHVLDVPGFEGIRIHAGNTVHDTDGCILVGQARNGSTVVRSKAALHDIELRVFAALQNGEKCVLEITSRGAVT